MKKKINIFRSGARNFSRFDLFKKQIEYNKDDVKLDEEKLLIAAEFIYEVSKSQNVTIQRYFL